MSLTKRMFFTPPLPHARPDASWRRQMHAVWRFRPLLWNLAIRNMTVKYQRSTLGFLWTLLNPLLTLTVLVIVFGTIVKLPVPHYWAFLVSGYFVWNFLSQMLSTAGYVLGEHAALRRSVAFPNEIPILGATVSRFMEFAVELTVIATVLMTVHHRGVPASFALLPVLLAILLLLTIGLVLPIATAAVFYHDVQHTTPALLITLFYVSPVFYPASFVPERLLALYFMNPIAGVLTLFQMVLYEGRFPPAPLLGGVGVMAVLVAIIGYGIFNRHKAVFAEIV